MSVTFTSFWPALLFLAVPFVWWMRAHTSVGLSPRHLMVSSIVRTTVIVLLVLALMQPVWNRAGTWISVVYALDVSSSVDPDFIDTAIDWVASSSSRGEPAHAGYIAFGGSARGVRTPEAIRSVEVSADGSNRSIDRSATNLETAVAQALRTFDPRYLKRLVLITDGNENDGDMMKVLGRAQEEGVRIFPMPATVRGAGDGFVEAIELPRGIREQEPVRPSTRYCCTVAPAHSLLGLGAVCSVSTNTAGATSLNQGDIFAKVAPATPISVPPMPPTRPSVGPDIEPQLKETRSRLMKTVIPVQRT